MILTKANPNRHAKPEVLPVDHLPENQAPCHLPIPDSGIAPRSLRFKLNAMRSIIILIQALLWSAFSNAQVNLPQGSAQVNIPIFSYSDNQSRVGVGVSLGYSSGHGLKVSDMASSVGTGWTLNAGGVVSRMQIGEPDDQVEKVGNFEDQTKFPPGYLFNTADVSAGCPVGMSYYPIFHSKYQYYKDHNTITADRELDLFTFSVNGRSGTFVIGKNRQIKLIGNARLKISFTEEDMWQQHIRTRISSFTITDENGVLYIFRDKNLKKILRQTPVNIDMSIISSLLQISFNTDTLVNHIGFKELPDEEAPFVVESWYLSEIRDPLNSRAVNFNYETQTIKNRTPDLITITESPKTVWFPVAGTNGYTPGISTKRHVTRIHNKEVVTIKKLKQINCPGGERLELVYGGARADIPDDNRLSALEVYDNSQLINRFELTHGYFTGNMINDQTGERLCLKSVQRKGYDDIAAEPPYKFEYFLGSGNAPDDIVAPPYSLCYDMWGYFNGSNSGLPFSDSRNLPFDEYNKLFDKTRRQPKNGYAKNGLLRKLTYPAGGSLEFEYEQNQDAASDLPGKITGGVRVKKSIQFDGISHSKDIVTEYRYELENGESSGWGFEPMLNESQTRVRYEPNGKWWNPLTGCEHSWKYPGVQVLDKAAARIARQQELSRWVGVVGSQIASTIGDLADIAEMSAVSAKFAKSFMIIMFIYNAIDVTIATCDDEKYIQDHFHKTFTTFNIKQPGALPFLYSRVEVKTISTGANNGKTILEFTGKDSYPLLRNENPYPYAPLQRLAGWAYGLPKRTIVFDALGRKVQESENSYSIIANELTDNNFLSCHCATQKRQSLSVYDWESNSYYSTGLTNIPAESITPVFYKPFTGRAELTLSRQRIYTSNGQFFETRTSYEYHPLNFQLKKTTTTNEKGETLEARMYYPEDFNLPGPIQKMKDQNIIGVPLASESWILKNNGYHLLSGTVTEFGEMPNGELKPVKSYAIENAQPLPESQIGAFNPNMLIRNPAFFKLQAEIKYKDSRLPVQTNARTRISSSIYDYNQRMVVAACTNAEEKDIAYTGFEAEGKGNWQYDPVNILATESMTGRRCFLLSASATITKTGLNANSRYFLTCWAKAGATVLLNGVRGVQIATVNGWVLYKFEFNDLTQLTISGTGLIDDLRLHPVGAFMTTYTYDPGIGKTSESDANNRITYYDYDGLGRLVHIRDEKRNIIKTTEYHYKEQEP